MLEGSGGSRSLARACAFFTLHDTLGVRTKEVQRVWQQAEGMLAPDGMESPEEFLDAVARMTGADRQAVRGTFDRIRNSMLAVGTRMRVIERGDARYPQLLAKVADAPRFLFVVGDLSLVSRPALAVIGTRKPTEEGARRARKLGYLLSKRGLVVTSGLALGIDEAAHLGALEHGGDTVAVLGTPVDRVYPPEHAELQKIISETGALVSQFHPGARVQRYFFPMRNAVMSGLSMGTVVVEASETSGALIQARKCLQQGRKLFIPQSTLERRDLKWPKMYVERGAHVFQTIDELLDVMEKECLMPMEMGQPSMGAISMKPLLTVDVR